MIDGVTGIVRRPVEGAKKEGVEGFFKGLKLNLYIHILRNIDFIILKMLKNNI